MLGYVCTNYNNSDYTRDAIASLVAARGGDGIRAVVVDNASHADDVARLHKIARDCPGVELILNRQNRGYFRGLNDGIRHLRQAADVWCIVIGNNDLVFPPEFIDQVERCRSTLDEWAVVAPDIVTMDGVHQNPHVVHPIGLLRRRIWDVYHSAYPLAMAIKRVAGATQRFTTRAENRTGNDLHRTAGPIDQGYGACYLLGPAFFRHFTGLAAPTFMLQEEFFLSEQLKQIGQQVFYAPSVRVRHRGHATMDQVPSRRHWMLSHDAHVIYKRYLAMSCSERKQFLVASVQESS